jgi:uncharacterized protein with NRDE domain
MCLAAIAIGQCPRFPWVLASNRDEYFRRPRTHLWPKVQRLKQRLTDVLDARLADQALLDAASTVVLVEQLGTRRQVRVVERSFDESGATSGQQEQYLDLIAR